MGGARGGQPARGTHSTRRLAPRGASVFRVPRRRSRRLELPTARIRTHAWRPDEWSTCFLSRRESRVPGQPDDVKSGHGRACSCIEARSSPAPHWSDWNWTPRPLIPPQGHAPPGTACTSTKYQDVGSTRRLETLLVSPQQPSLRHPSPRQLSSPASASSWASTEPGFDVGDAPLVAAPSVAVHADVSLHRRVRERACQRAVVGLSPPHHLPPTYARTAPGTARSLCYGDTTVLPVYASACPFRKKSSAQHEAHIASGFRTPLRVLRAP